MPLAGFVPPAGEEADNSPLTLAVSCLMSYERTGERTAVSHLFLPVLPRNCALGEEKEDRIVLWISVHMQLARALLLCGKTDGSS